MTGKVRRVLIVDSDPVFVGALSARLAPQGYDVEAAEGITQAVQRLNDVDFDCVVLDMGLPGASERGALSILGAVSPQVPIIATSEANSWGLEAKVRRQEAFYYHLKSFDLAELEVAVADACKSVGKPGRPERGDRPARILVVDDDPDYIAAVQLILESKPHEVRIAYGKNEALEMIEAEKPDLILLDMMMDTLVDGLSISYKVKHTPGLRHIPVVIITALDERPGFVTPGPAGTRVLPSDGYLQKPVKSADLLRCVEKFLG